MSTNPNALLSSKKSRRLTVQLDEKVNAIGEVAGLTAAVVNEHTKAFFSRGFFGKLKYLVLGK